MRKVLILVMISITIFSCKEYASKETYTEKLSDNTYFLSSVSNLTDISVHDIFSPPVASRVYAYPSIAAYEAICRANKNYKSLAGQLKGLDSLNIEVSEDVSFELAAIYAFNNVAKHLIFSEDKFDLFTTSLDSQFMNLNIHPRVLNESRDYAKVVSDHIIRWSNEDNYNQTRSMPKFSITDKKSEWKPTPPAYMEGIEPHWNKIRTMVIDSANQFVPVPPPPYDMSEGSDFRKLVLEVYETVNNIDKEQKEIASFWDCNPYVMNQTGHVMFAIKKITPGGHWMGITRIACEKSDMDLIETVSTHALVSITLFDAFISCWDEKYRSNLIRPESVINEHLDPDWIPTLQTPPFPEHTSGHSVISTASSVMLSSIFGNNFDFVDDVEVPYGLPIRSFDSFQSAAAEAAISRLYGGIHYMPAITDGVTQGKEVGKYIVENLKLKTN